MHDAQYSIDLDWVRQIILLVLLTTFGVCFAWYFEWLRKAKENNEQNDRLWTIKDRIEAALLPWRSQSTTPPASSVTQIAGRCLPSCLALAIKKRHGSRPCGCNLNQCDGKLEKDERLPESQEDATYPQAEQDGTTIDNNAPPADIDGVKQYLVNAIDTRLLVQERCLWKRTEKAGAARDRALAEHDGTESEHEVTKAKLTHIRTQFSDRDTALEESSQLQQRNSVLRETQEELNNTIAKLRQEAEELKERVKELEEEFCLEKQSLHSADEEIERFKAISGRSDDSSKQALLKMRTTSSVSVMLDPNGDNFGLGSETSETSIDCVVPFPATSGHSAKKVEQDPVVTGSTVPSQGEPKDPMPSNNPPALSISAPFVNKRSTPTIPATSVTTGEENVPSGMKRCKNL
ncbi:hypothetical protein E8E12_009627 [Didymella heteroderae]|uniref:Uncharacterized protein n=1 Tax=Didymella heteroderae TaxID=1769908 RepID=A0A9P4WWJ4_9PLEO|nr:hypothetical protein E8E12_009627 [Didymella heteroderae]